MEELLQPRRHPKVVSESTAIANSAQDYEPPAELDAGRIQGNPWGKRLLLLPRPVTQYMVYDKLGRNVLSCCSTPELAAQKANDRLERESIPPQDYSPRLVGMTFGHRAEGNILLHTVLDSQGAEIAGSTDGRAVAAAEAVKSLVSRPECVDATREEFASTIVFAKVARGVGRKTLPLVYDNANDESDMDLVSRELRALWRVEPNLQVDKGGEVLRGNPDIKAFVTAAHSSLLQYGAQLGGDVALLNIRLEKRVMRLVFHSRPISRDAAIDHLYAEYLGESSENSSECKRARAERESA